MKPLEGLVVVEAASWVAAPSAAVVLADLGADVIKVEPMRGDAIRGMLRQPRRPDGVPAFDAPFHADNRGKRSIAVALDRPEGGAVVARLVERADVFVTNLLPHRQERFGLDAKTLLAVQPKLVHATFSGYGLQGPDATRPGYDATAFFGRGGVLDAMTDPGSVTPYPRPAQGDHTAGLALVAGVLSSLLMVQRTGVGQVVDSSLLSAAIWTMTTDLSAVLVDGRPPAKRDRHHLITPLTNRFQCRDGRWLMLNMPEAHWWPRFCQAVGRTAWLDDPRYATVKDRFYRMPELVDEMDQLMSERTLAEWSDLLDGAGLIWAPLRTLVEVAADEQAQACGLFPEIEREGERFRTVAVPFRIDGADVGPRGPGPDLGEHTEDVLAAAGFPAVEVEELLQTGIVASRSSRDPY